MLETEQLSGAAARRQRSRQEMRTAILDDGRRLIDAAGIDGVTIRAIARAIGYTPGALYEYFDSREAIIKALYFEGAGGLGGHSEATLAALPADVSPAAAMRALGHAYRAYALEHAELYRLIFGGLKELPPPPPVANIEDQAGGFGTLVRVARRGIEAGVFIALPPPVIAIAAWSAVHGFVSLELSGHVTGGDGPGMLPPSAEAGRQRRDQLFDALLRMVLFGLVRDDERRAVAMT